MTELWIRIDPEAQPSLIAQDRDLTLTEMQAAVGGLIELHLWAQCETASALATRRRNGLGRSH